MELNQVHTGPGDEGWAVEACTLPTAERPLRVAEFDALFAEAVTEVRTERPGRVRMALRAGPQIAGRAAELAVAETGCCSFFTFALVATGDGVALEISVGDEHVEVLNALAVRAAQAMAGS